MGARHAVERPYLGLAERPPGRDDVGLTILVQITGRDPDPTEEGLLEGDEGADLHSAHRHRS